MKVVRYQDEEGKLHITKESCSASNRKRQVRHFFKTMTATIPHGLVLNSLINDKKKWLDFLSHL